MLNSLWLETFPSERFLFQQSLGMPIRAVAPAALGRGEPCVLRDGGFDSYTVLFLTAGPLPVSGQSPSGIVMAHPVTVRRYQATDWTRINRELAPVGMEKLFEQ